MLSSSVLFSAHISILCSSSGHATLSDVSVRDVTSVYVLDDVLERRLGDGRPAEARRQRDERLLHDAGVLLHHEPVPTSARHFQQSWQRGAAHT